MAMSPYGEANRSISLGSSAADWARYVKAQCKQSWLWAHYRVEQGLPQL